MGGGRPGKSSKFHPCPCAIIIHSDSQQELYGAHTTCTASQLHAARELLICYVHERVCVTCLTGQHSHLTCKFDWKIFYKINVCQTVNVSAAGLSELVRLVAQESTTSCFIPLLETCTIQHRMWQNSATATHVTEIPTAIIHSKTWLTYKFHIPKLYFGFRCLTLRRLAIMYIQAGGSLCSPLASTRLFLVVVHKLKSRVYRPPYAWEGM